MGKARIVFCLVVLCIVGCSTKPSGGKKYESKIEISAQEMRAAKERVGNDSMSNVDLILSVLQGVPAFPLGTKAQDIMSELTKSGFSITHESPNTLLVYGKHNAQGNAYIENVDQFRYTFENTLLVSGPNRVQAEANNE